MFGPLAPCSNHLPRVNKGQLFIYLFIYLSTKFGRVFKLIFILGALEVGFERVKTLCFYAYPSLTYQSCFF